MTDLTRQMLDELMGKERNLPLKDRNKRKEYYYDPEQKVCKYFLVSVCPHDLFPNTKSDLGKCSKRHDDFYKRQYEEDPDKLQHEKKYINETIRFFESMLVNIDSKIKRAQMKLDASSSQSERPKELQDRIDTIDADIKRMLQEMEKLGEEGKIEESENISSEIEKLKARKEEMVQHGDPSNNPSKQMKVCEVCGALQSTNDTEKRTQTHLEGKLHTGFGILRKELEVLKKRRDDIKNEENQPKRDKKEKEERRSRSKDKRKKKSASRSRSAKKKSRKDRKSRSRSRSRSKDRKKQKSKKEHKGKSKSRSKSRSRSSHKKSKKKAKKSERSGSRDNQRHREAQEKEKFKNAESLQEAGAEANRD